MPGTEHAAQLSSGQSLVHTHALGASASSSVHGGQ